MTDSELKRLESLCEKATPGPWEKGDFDVVGPGNGPNTETLVASIYRHGFTKIEMSASHETSGPSLFEDADFIAAARTALPALVVEIRQLQVHRDFLEREIDRLRALVADVERVDTSTGCCPWCYAGPDVPHHDCPAFTPDGTVK